MRLRPGIDGITLIARAIFGRPKWLSKHFRTESPSNDIVNTIHDEKKSPEKIIAFEKIKPYGQFSFKARKSLANSSSHLPIITYHHHLPSNLKESSIFQRGSVTNTLESFADQISWLHENGYSTLTLSEFESYLDGFYPLEQQKKILITFDDGHLSLARFCYPILKQFNFTAVVFLITGYQPIFKENQFNPNKLQYISREEMKNLSDVFEWGAHTHKLHFRDKDKISRLISIGTQDMISDAIQNRELLNGTKHFCFPFGQYNQTIIDTLAKIGFKYFYTTEKGFATPDPNNEIHLIRRLNISPRMSISNFSSILKNNQNIAPATLAGAD